MRRWSALFGLFGLFGLLVAVLAGCSLARDLDRLREVRASAGDAGVGGSSDPAPISPERGSSDGGSVGTGDAGRRARAEDAASADGFTAAEVAGSAVDGGPAPDGADSGAPRPSDAAAWSRPSALFWVDSGSRSVHRAGPNGEAPQVIVRLPEGSIPRSIVVDEARRKITFTDSGSKKIWRASFDGTGLEAIVGGLDQPRGIGIDAGRGKIYFADQGAMPTVFRANLDGTKKEIAVRVTIRHPHGLVVDGPGGKIYFVDDELRAVFRANLDGSRLERLPIPGIEAPVEIALDPLARKIYWSDTGAGASIRRANLDGSGVEAVVDRTRVPGLGQPLGLAVDPAAGQLVFVDGNRTGGSARIVRLSTGGGAPEALIEAGLADPRGLALAF